MSLSHDAVSDLILQIYDAVYADDSWSALIDRIADLLDGSSAAFGVQTTLGAGSAQVLHSLRFDPESLHRFQTRFGRMPANPLNAAHLKAPLATPFRYEDHLDRRRFERSELFADVFHSAKLVNWLPMTLERRCDLFAVVNFLRSPSQTEFSSDHIGFLRVIGPHLRRATRLYLELGRREDLGSAYEAALWPLGYGVALLRADGRPTFLNAVAEQAVKAGDGLKSSDGQLETAKASERSRLKRLIASAAGANGGTPEGDGVAISRPNGGLLSCLAFPIVGTRRFIFDQPPAVMLLFRAIDAKPENSVGELARLHGLSPRQAQIVHGLLEGDSLTAIASKLDLSLETARTHLRRIFMKTRTRGQGDLICQIARGPLATLRDGDFRSRQKPSTTLIKPRPSPVLPPPPDRRWRP